MIELERHIEILLLSNDCVIVPELGGFMAHYVNASYDEDGGLFLPPLRTLGFNPQLTMNDSLLVQSYIEAYDISYPEALRRVECEVAELRQHLENEGKYELNDIGVLRLNEEGHMEFDPCEAGILTPALYGLSSFEMRPIEQQQATVAMQQSTVTVPEQLPVDDVQEMEPVVAQVVEESDKEESQTLAETVKEEPAIVIKMSWLRNAVAVAAAILAFFFIQTPVSNSHLMSDVQQSSVLPIVSGNDAQIKEDVAQSIAPTEEAKTEQENAVADSQQVVEEQESDATSDATIKSDEPIAQSEPSYCIVLASQTTQRHADDFIDQLNKKGFNEARVMEMHLSKKVRVVYGEYKSEQDAYESLRQLRKQQKDFQEAWIMKL
ncbi:MAG: SPOR domain-containing protein [Prevotella sp.]|nr:SPOR domain-containing protein [Prevotella sp.]